MTGKQRLARATSLQRPDRVPVMCQMSMGHIYLKTGLSPLEVWHDPQVYAQALSDMRGRYAFDGILVSVPGGDPDWRSKIAEATDEPGGLRVRWTQPPLNRSPYPLGDETLYPPDDLPRPVHPDPPPSLEDLDPATIDTLDDVPDWMLSNLRAAREVAGEEWAVHGETISPFDKLLEVLGMEAGLMALVDDPAKTHGILQKGLEYGANWAVAQVRDGCDAMKLSSPFVGNGFLSRPMYREFVLPYETELIRRVHEAAPNVPVYTHTCGAIGDRLELIAESGADGIECLDPPPLGDVELADAVERIGDRLFIKGNIDSVNTLLYKPPVAIRRDVEAILRTGMRARGFILSTACSIAPGVPEEHVRIIADVAAALGHYA
jgi:uroporphyrinogen-III decarboxylase